MESVKRKTIQIRFRSLWVIALIAALLMSLTIFSASAFADGPEEAAAETSISESGGAAPAGQSGGGAPAGESGGTAPAGESGGGAPAGQSGGAAPAGESGGGAPAGQSGGAAPAGESGGGAPAGQSGGEAPAGQSGGEAPAGQPEGEAPAGQTEGEAPAGQSEGEAPAGQTEGEAPAGQTEGEAPAGQTEGEAPAGQTEGEAPAGQTEGEAPAGQTEGEAPAGQPEGEVPEETASAKVNLAASDSLGALAAPAEPEKDVEVEIKTASETIKVATADLHEHGETDKNPLEKAIYDAVKVAVDGVAHVVLDPNTKYEGKGVSLTYDVSKYIFDGGESGTATINSDIELSTSAVFELINVLFGNDCTVIVDGGGELTLGENKDGKRFTGKVNVVAGDPDPETTDSPGKVTVYAGDGASVLTDLPDGTFTIVNSAGDSVTFPDNGTLEITSLESEYTDSTEKRCTITISDSVGVVINKINAWDADVVISSPRVTIGASEDRHELRSLKIIAASEDSQVFNLTDSMHLSGILSKLGVKEALSAAAFTENAVAIIGGNIKALEDITIYSFTTQTRNSLNTQFGNLGANVKIGNASICVAEGVELEAGRDITMKATTRSTAGLDEAGKPLPGLLPVAFNVFVESAEVELRENTKLTAGRDITADALGTVTASAMCAQSGLAFNVVVNRASVTMVKTTLNAGRDVNLISRAETTAVADAERGPGEDKVGGIYLATNVVVQDSKVHVGESAKINGIEEVTKTDGVEEVTETDGVEEATKIDAKGNVNISSTSNVDATDDAISAVSAEAENVSAFPLKTALTTIGNDLLGQVLKFIKESEYVRRLFANAGDFFTFASSKIEAAQKFFQTDGYVVEIDPSSQEKGSVKTSVISDSNDKLTVTVDSKYKVDQVLIRYLPYPKDSTVEWRTYKFIEAPRVGTADKFEVNLLKAIQEEKEDIVTLGEFRVYVIYSDEMKSEVELQDMPEEDDDDDEFGLSFLFDLALEAAGDDIDVDTDCAGSVMLKYAYKFKGDWDPSPRGFVCADAMAAGVGKGTMALSALAGVAEGKNVRLNASPAIINTTRYKVKSMEAAYLDSTGKEQHSVIEKNNAGHYVVTVPTGIQGDLWIITEFEIGDEAADAPETPSSNQLTGSLGVGVVVNHNNAVVDLGSGSITAGGEVNVTAEGTSNIAGKSDGTSVTEATKNRGVTAKKAAVGTNQTSTTVKIKKDGVETEEKLLVYGRSLEKAVSAVVNGTVYTVTLAPNNDYGNYLPKTITMVVLGEDNREHFIEVTGQNGVYTVDTEKIDFKNDKLTDTKQNSGFVIRNKKLIAVYDAKTYSVYIEPVKNGSMTTDRISVCGLDTITVTATPNEGFSVEKVLLKYVDEYGSTIEVPFTAALDHYIYLLPKDSELAKWGKLTANTSPMAIVVTFTEDPDKHEIRIQEGLDGVVADKQQAASGQKVTLRAADGRQLILDPKKFNISYKGANGEDVPITLNPDLTFTVPVKGAIAADAAIIVDGRDFKEEAKVTLTPDSGIENGSLSVNHGKTMTGSGDIFYVTVKGNEGYLIKAGTLRAEYVSSSGSETVKLSPPVCLGNGVYSFSVPETIGNNGGKVTVMVEFEKGEASSSSTGVAVAVNVTVHRNNADIRSGSVSAGKGIAVKALTNGKADTVAKAGYSSAKTGVAGAIAVGVNSYKTNAFISKGVSLSENNGAEPVLSVSAESNISSFTTDADATNMKIVPDPSGKGYIVPGFGIVVPNDGVAKEGSIVLPGIGMVKPNLGTAAGKLGVGTGIAVAVNGVNTRAAINDGVVYNYTGTPGMISVTAGNTIASDTVNAKAGAASGKTAVSPVVALNIITSDASAYAGRVEKLTNGQMMATPLTAKFVQVKASNSAAHKMTVATYALGTATAMAGSFGINIINDIASSLLNCDVRGAASEVAVDAESLSSLEAYVAAGSNGAKQGKKEANDSKGSADQKADNIIASGEKLAAKAGMGSSTEDTIKNRQQAQTSEGAIAGAAAFALNIQRNTGDAKIADGVSLGGNTSASALKNIRVSSRTQTSANLACDSSATSVTEAGKSIGIGVSVAINIVNTNNKAYLGSGNLNASGDVLVAALNALDNQDKELTNEFYTSAVSGASAGGVGVAGSVALAVLNNTTSALINKAENDMYSAGSTTVRAEDRRFADTTASASATQAGRADKNSTKTDDKKAADADSGKSVGVGASFAMVYGDNKVFAKFVAPIHSDAGDLIVSAGSDHSEESTAVAGADAYKNLFPVNYDFTSGSTNISIDAAAAVNAIETAVEALLAAGNYSSTVNAKTVRLSAVEKGHSKTDSSGYALGTNTAVGGSVAVNLNRSTVRASNGCFLKVKDGDYTGDDEEGHQRSVEITASSEVTEENNAFATAGGGDILRYVEKYKSLLNTIDHYKNLVSFEVMQAEQFANLIKAFLDGSLFNEIKTKFDDTVKTCEDLIKQIKEKVAGSGKVSPEDAEKLKKLQGSTANSQNSIADKLLKLLQTGEELKNIGSKLNSLSSNLLMILKVASPSTSKMDDTTGKAAGETNKEAGDSGTKIDNNGAANKESESLQIAAAVGVSVSNHTVLAENKGEIETKGAVRIIADNSVDALAHSFGAAFSSGGGTGSIGLAIAVKVDNNTVKAFSEKSITVGSGKDVIISANLNENTHNFSGNESGSKIDFTTTIGTQAVAGAVSGGAKVAISGAVVVFVSTSDILAELADKAIVQAADNGRAGNVSILATETARQTMRTTALSASSAKLALGLSIGVLTTKSTTTARVGKNASIKAKDISVKAERKSVNPEDNEGIEKDAKEGKPDFGDKGDEGDDDDGSGPIGIGIKGLGLDPILEIDTSKATTGQAGETISVNINQDQVVALLEKVLSSLSDVDYYIEIASGSVAASSDISASSGIGSIAGSVAVATINNSVSAIVDEFAILDAAENVSVEARSEEQTRLIAGSVSADTAASAKAAVGAVIAFLDDGCNGQERNAVNALVKDGAVITAGAAFSLIGKNTGRSEVYTVTGSAAENKQPAGANIAATVDVILTEAAVVVKLGNPGSGKAHTAQTARIIAENSKSFRNITATLVVGNGKVQVGGAVAVISDNGSSSVIADSTTLHVTGKFAPTDAATGEKIVEDSLVIKADNTHNMFVIVCSASAAVGSGSGSSAANAAGVVSVILDTSSAIVSTKGSVFTSNCKTDFTASNFENAGNIVIAALNNSDLLNINVQVTAGAGKGEAVGAAVTVNILRRTVENTVSTADRPTTIRVGNGNVSLTADAIDTVVIIAAGATGTNANVSIQGTVVVLVENNSAKLTAQNITLETTNLTPSFSIGDITVRAKFTGELYGVSGGVNFSIGSGIAAAGASVIVAVTDNKTIVDLSNNSTILGSGKVEINSAADTTTLFISIGACISNATFAVEGSVVTVVASDEISIHLGNVSVRGLSVIIDAKGKSTETYISGALSVSDSVSVGPSVLVFVKQRKVRIDSAAGGKIGGENGCNVTAIAHTDDNIFTLVLAMAATAGSASVSAGVCTEIINNTVECNISADINAGRSEIDIQALSERTIRNYIFGGGFANVAAVVPVATVIYLTDTVTSNVSGSLKGHTVNVKADTKFTLREVAAGVAVAGTAGISGTFAVVINKADTRATFTGSHTGEGDTTGLNVLANDNYKFNSIIANVAGGLTAGVGVTAAITIVKNNVLASIGDEKRRQTINADTVNVDAKSTRDITNRIGVLSFGGTAGVSVNVAVVVAGSMLPQDAYDALTRDFHDKNGNGEFVPVNGNSCFDSVALLNSIGKGNAYVRNRGYLNTVTLSEDVQDNGQKDSNVDVQQVDGKPLVEGLASNKTQDYSAPDDTSAMEADKLRGEDSTIDPTDLSAQNAKAGESVGYTYSENAVTAAVQALVFNVDINCLDLSISADDVQKAEIDSITGSVGGTAGVSVGVTVLVLHSNVVATLEQSANVTCRTLSINASSGTGDDGKILLFGGTVAGSFTAGAAVTVAVAHLDNVIVSTLAGKVTALAQTSGIANAVSVVAKSNYKDVSASTISIGVGAVGVSASVAVVSLNGTVRSAVTGKILSAHSESDEVTAGFSSVNVMVFFNNSITATAVGVGGGILAANAGVAVASETLRLTAAIEKIAEVELDNTVNSAGSALRVLVAGSFDGKETTQGKVKSVAQVAGVSGGAVAAGVSVAVAYLKPTINSYIDGTVRKTLPGLAVTVGNDVYTESETSLASASVGEISFGGNVLVAYNNTVAESTVAGSVHADSLTVMSLLSANAVSSMISASAGKLALGASTAISILNAVNDAFVGNNADIRVGTLNILAGATAPGDYQSGADFFSDAQLFSGAVGAGTIQLNVAVAINKAFNKARLNSTGNVFADSVNVYAYGNPTSSAATNKLAAALAGAGGSAAASTLNFTQIVEINCTVLNGLNGGLTAVNGGSYMYPGKTGKVTRDHDQACSSVDIFAITGLSIAANVSYAKNTTTSKITASFASKIGPVRLINNGSANARANIAEAGGNVLGIGANVVLGYVQAHFITDLKTSGVDGNVEAMTDFISNASATAESASSQLMGLNVNVIVAKSTTEGSTTFDGRNSDVKAEKINVTTVGISTTQAGALKPRGIIDGALLQVKVMAIAGNVVESILRATNKAELKDVHITGSPDINVSSILNASADSKPYSAQAIYQGAPDSVELTFKVFEAAVNVILAKNYATNEAKLSHVVSSDKLGHITVLADNKANAFANAGTFDKDGKAKDKDNFDVTLIGVGVVVSIASNESHNTAKVEQLQADAEALDVTANQDESFALSAGGTSSGGAIQLAGIKVNVSNANNKATNDAIIAGSRAAIDKIVLKTAAEKVYASAYIGSAKISVNLVKIAANVVTATNNYTGNALINESALSGRTLDVSSVENQLYYLKAYSAVTTANVGSAGAANNSISVSLLTGDVNSAVAEDISKVNAIIRNSVLTKLSDRDYDVSIFAYGRSDTLSSIAGSSTVGLLSVNVITTSAVSNGTVLAEFDPGESESHVSSLKVESHGDAKAEAITGVAGDLSASLVDTKANVASANVTMNVKAVVSGGKLRVDKAAVVNALASSNAHAEARSPSFALSLLGIAVNVATATGNITISADVLPGVYTFGSLDVRAGIPTTADVKYIVNGTKYYFDTSTTSSLVSPSFAGTKEQAEKAEKTSVGVNLFGGKFHQALANSKHIVNVNLGNKGIGSITADSIALSAVGNAITHAVFRDVDVQVGLVSAGGSLARAEENDVAEIHIDAADVQVKGSLTVGASNDSADVHAEGTTPGGFACLEVLCTNIEGAINNTARIWVGGKVSADTIRLAAANAGKATTNLINTNGTKYGLITVDNANVPVVETFNTEIIFGGNSKVEAARGFTMSTETNSISRSEVTQATGGIIFNTANLYGKSTVNSNNTIKVGANTSLSAKNGDLAVRMIHSGDHKAFSDYTSPFGLISKNTIKAELYCYPKNNFEMETGSSVSSDNGNVSIEQRSSDLELSCYSETRTRMGVGDAKAIGTNTVTSDNTVRFADILAGKAIAISQYGGVRDASAYGKVIESGAITGCTSTGVNNITINNTAEALNNGDLNAADIMIMQGADRLNMYSDVRAETSTFSVKLNGGAENSVRINNKLSGGSRKIGENATSRAFVSDAEAEGSIECRKAKETLFISFGDITAKNSLLVTSTIGDNYSGFKRYQNTFDRSKISGAADKDTVERYTFIENPVGGPYGPYPKPKPVSTKGTDPYSAPASASVSSSIVEMYLKMYINARQTLGGKERGNGIKVDLDNNGLLVIENCAMFAADLDQMDVNWLYAFLTVGNVKFKAAFSNFSELDLNTPISEIVSSAFDAENVTVSGHSIRFSVANNGEKHSYEIVFDEAHGTVSAFCTDGGKMLPVSIVVIEQDGVMNVILYYEEEGIKPAFIFIPALVDEALPVIKVKVKESMLRKLFF